jgi:cell division protein FtsN
MAKDYKTRRSSSNGFSGWLGMGLGLALGLAIAVGIYVKDHKPDVTAVKPSKHEKRRSADTDVPPEDEAPAKSYDFYDMLPKFEVVVPEKEKDVKSDTRAVPETRPGTYVLQAGSYKNFSDADRIRAQLALQGIESKVQKVSVDTDTWHRIRIGPLSNLEELNRMRQKLRKSDIDVLVIRVGD